MIQVDPTDSFKLRNLHMIAFISDLHLSSAHPEITERFHRFISSYGIKAAAVYILGDLFDYWIGDDIETPTSRAVSDALQQLRQKKIPCYFMPGNRDFLLGEQFAKKAGLILLADPSVIDLYGERVLLMHGDSLCTQDHRYMAYRKKVRDPNVQQRFLAKPRFLRLAIARFLRLRSKLYNRYATREILDVTPGLAEIELAKHGLKTLIHGHTHRPKIHPLSINGQKGQRIVLGAWHEAGNVLLCTPDHEKRLIYF